MIKHDWLNGCLRHIWVQVGFVELSSDQQFLAHDRQLSMYFHFPRQVPIVCARSRLHSSTWQCSSLWQYSDQRPPNFAPGQYRGPYWTWSTSSTPYCACLSSGFVLYARWPWLAFAGSASRKRQIHLQCSNALFETGPLHSDSLASKAI